MSPGERQQKLLEVLCHRRHDTIDNLAREFKVSRRTICRDLVTLMCSYPVETVRGRYGGGVRISEGFYMNRHSYECKVLGIEQIEILKKPERFSRAEILTY